MDNELNKEDQIGIQYLWVCRVLDMFYSETEASLMLICMNKCHLPAQMLLCLWGERSFSLSPTNRHTWGTHTWTHTHYASAMRISSLILHWVVTESYHKEYTTGWIDHWVDDHENTRNLKSLLEKLQQVVTALQLWLKWFWIIIVNVKQSG